MVCDLYNYNNYHWIASRENFFDFIFLFGMNLKSYRPEIHRFHWLSDVKILYLLLIIKYEEFLVQQLFL